MPTFTTEFTQTQVDSLSRNIALGVLEVEHNGKRTRFSSSEEMMALRDRMKLEIAAAAAAAAAAAGGMPSPMPSMTRRTVFWRD